MKIYGVTRDGLDGGTNEFGGLETKLDEAQELATTTGLTVYFVHNDLTFGVSEGSDVDAIAKFYFATAPEQRPDVIGPETPVARV